MLFSIVLTYLAGGSILILSKQSKHLNIFEILGLGFGIGLSLFVMESIFSTILFKHITILIPAITSLLLVGFVLWGRKKGDTPPLLSDWKKTGEKILHDIKIYGTWRKIGVFFFLVMVLFKIALSFMTNLSHPTLGEDAVTGWDLKTKVFFENKSIVLDKQDPENLGGEYKRSIFAPLIDLYFLLPYDELPDGYTNIISSLIYLNTALLLFGIFLRKYDSFIASMAAYIWVSLPIIFIHSIDAYFNLVSGYFLFSFAFYISDQVILKKERNLLILFPLGILVFLDSSIRSESLLLVSTLLVIDFIFLFLAKAVNKKNSISFLPILVGISLSWAVNKYLHSFSPKENIMTDGFDIFSVKSLSSFFEHISNSKTLMAPLEQSLYHPDYNLLYLIFLGSLIFIFIKRFYLKEFSTMLVKTFALYAIFLAILYIEPAFGLEDAFGFIRYSMALIPFALFFPVSVAGELYRKKFQD
ncbi:MAG: hypothetical protein HHAS10_02390 [Candidatus Altimarinota bacterium]